MKTELALLTVLFLTLALPAQCPFSTATGVEIGPGCEGLYTGPCDVDAPPVTLLVQWNPAQCTLDVTVHAPEVCGATVPATFLVVGTQQVAIDISHFGVGCTLYAVPVLFLTASGTSYSLPMVPEVSSLVLQGAAVSSDGFSGPDKIVPSNALLVTLQ